MCIKKEIKQESHKKRIGGNMRFARKLKFKKDTPFRIDKPKYRETLMKSKSQHVDDAWDQRISKRFNSVCRCALKKKVNNKVVKIA